MEHPDIPGGASFCEANVWPDEEDLPGWHSLVLGQLEGLRELTCVLMRAIARGLDLDPEPFAEASAGRNASIRLLHQPERRELIQNKNHGASVPCEGNLPTDLETLSDGRTIVTGGHLDQNLLSVLWQSSAGWLQMQVETAPGRRCSQSLARYLFIAEHSFHTLQETFWSEPRTE